MADVGNNWGGILGEIQTRDPKLYDKLYTLDLATNGILFGDDERTVSHTIATRAQSGDSVAIALCTALNVLSPDHCARVLAGDK